MNEAELNGLARVALDRAFRVHTALGPGLLESSYRACLAFELAQAGCQVQTEVPIPLVYGGVKLGDVGYRLDILVAGELIVEVKAIEAVAPVHRAQLLSYLRLSGRRLGLLLNFNVVMLRDGITRIVNKLYYQRKGRKERKGTPRGPLRNLAFFALFALVFASGRV